jgi:hypothetical protein
VLISMLILPVALLWAALYLAFGSPVGWVPLVYFAILLAAMVGFSRTRDSRPARGSALPARCDSKAIPSPRGDQEGTESTPRASVSRRTFPPSASMT